MFKREYNSVLSSVATLVPRPSLLRGALAWGNIGHLQAPKIKSAGGGGDEDEQARARELGAIVSPEGIETGEIVSHINCP